jgi:hypothetical protein
MSKIAVVILNWNGINFLKKFLPILIEKSNTPEVELWVADNNSQDKSLEYIKENFPKIKTLSFNKNYGFAEGYNKALSQINAQYFVLLNSDVEVTDNWIMPIIEYMDNHPEVAAAQPKILSYHNKSKFEYAGAAGGYIDKYGYPFCRGRILNTIEEDTGQYNTEKEIFWASGACLFIRANDFLNNKFDEDFFAHMEEIDLCWRLKNKNKKIMYLPKSKIYHVGGGTLPQNSPHKLYLNFRNNLLLLYKNLPKNDTFKIIIQRMFLDGISAIFFLLKLQFSYFYAVIKAHIHFYKLLKKFKNKRRKLLIFNKKQKLIYNKSIVFDYFFKKKHKFDDLIFSNN